MWSRSVLKEYNISWGTHTHIFWKKKPTPLNLASNKYKEDSTICMQELHC